MAQHKWHKEIIHWANGGEIEVRQREWVYDKKMGNQCLWSIWKLFDSNIFYDDDDIEYRIKPQPKEPQYLYVYLDDNYELSTIPLDNDDWKYIGKIKLEDTENE